MSKPKFPVKPIGSFKYSDVYPRSDDYNSTKKATFEHRTSCKGHGKDRPFSVYEELGAKDPFCIVMDWVNDNHGYKTVTIQGRKEKRLDSDTYHMFSILERYDTLLGAQKAMRRFAAEATAKIPEPPKRGEVCRNKIGRDQDITVRVGDLVLYECDNFVGEGIVWKVLGEVRKDDHWYLRIVPVYSATRTFEDRAEKLMGRGLHYLRPCDLLTLANGHLRFTNFIAEEKKRLEGE